MNEREFFEKTGRHPQDDDMIRVNCMQVGEIGHAFCGWCSKHDSPRFMCMCNAPTENEVRLATLEAQNAELRAALERIQSYCVSAGLKTVNTGDKVAMAVYLSLHEAGAALAKV